MHDWLVGSNIRPLGLVTALAAGTALGLVFYTGLWWTVRRAGTFRWPALTVLVSLLLRMSLTLGGFYLVASDDSARLLTCLAGFLFARAVVTRRTRLASSPAEGMRAEVGTSRAP